MIKIDRIVKYINKKYDNKLKINYVILQKKELINTKASIKKIIKFTNYHPKINLRKSIISHYE